MAAQDWHGAPGDRVELTWEDVRVTYSGPGGRHRRSQLAGGGGWAPRPRGSHVIHGDRHPSCWSYWGDLEVSLTGDKARVVVV